MTTNGDMTPRPPDDHDTPERAIRDGLDLVDETVAKITDAEVEEQLRRVLGQSGPDEPILEQGWRECQTRFSLADTRPSMDASLVPSLSKAAAEMYNPDLVGLTGSLEAAVEAARSAAARITADAQMKAKAASDELRRAQEAVAAARQQAEQIVADARAEADEALERAVRMIRIAGNQARQILNDARDEAEQIVSAARNQQVHQAAWAAPGLEVYEPKVFRPSADYASAMMVVPDRPLVMPDQYGTIPFGADLASLGTVVFHLNACSSQRPFEASVLRSWEQPRAFYGTLVHDRGIGVAVRAGRIAVFGRNSSTRTWATDYQKTLLVRHLNMLLARYADEHALADARPRLWKLAADHGDPDILARYLNMLLAPHHGHAGQDAPLDPFAAGPPAVPGAYDDGPSGLSGGKADYRSGVRVYDLSDGLDADVWSSAAAVLPAECFNRLPIFEAVESDWFRQGLQAVARFGGPSERALADTRMGLLHLAVYHDQGKSALADRWRGGKGRGSAAAGSAGGSVPGLFGQIAQYHFDDLLDAAVDAAPVDSAAGLKAPATADVANQVADAITATLEAHGCPRGSWQSHLLCGALAAVAQAMKAGADPARTAVIEGVTAALAAGGVPRPAAGLAGRAAADALMRLGPVRHYEDVRRTVQMLAVATCPNVADHPEAERYCLQPTVSTPLSPAIEEELAQVLPYGDR